MGRLSTTLAQLPTSTDESTALSKDLKRRGFRFVGPTTVYAFMQAAGLADDHVVTCFRPGRHEQRLKARRGVATGRVGTPR